jgi:four helix bundle protein
MKYDLEERVKEFGKNTIVFVKKLKLDSINRPLVSQIVRSATSVGANYMEANQACSKKDFRNKISICRKEANKTKHWFSMIETSDNVQTPEFKKLENEAHQLTLIFSKIFKTCSKID